MSHRVERVSHMIFGKMKETKWKSKWTKKMKKIFFFNKFIKIVKFEKRAPS